MNVKIAFSVYPYYILTVLVCRVYCVLVIRHVLDVFLRVNIVKQANLFVTMEKSNPVPILQHWNRDR